MSSDKVIVLTKENFEQEVTKSDMPILVDFWAPWCGPCRSVAPILVELAEHFDGKLLIGKLNVDEEGQIAEKFKIMSIPTMMIFKKGEVVEKVIGARTKEEFVKLLSAHQ